MYRNDIMKLAIAELLSQKRSYVLAGCDAPPNRAVLLAGSFNPLHCGHTGLLRAVLRASGLHGFLELSLVNVDKPPLTAREAVLRVAQIGDVAPVVLTCASTFAQKAELFPGCWFALGYDTVVRLLNPAYHDDIPAMLARFQELEVRFVVAGRLCGGRYRVMEELVVPVGFDDLFIPISETVFREDISSTYLRCNGD